MNTEHEKGILLMRANSTVKGLRLEHLLQGCFAGEEKFWILSALARSVRGSRQGSRLPKHTSCSCAFATARSHPVPLVTSHRIFGRNCHKSTESARKKAPHSRKRMEKIGKSLYKSHILC